MAKRTKRRPSVNLFGLKIPIKYIDMKETEACGLYSHEKKIIVIEKSQIGLVAQHTLLHECVHAIFDRTGINQSLSSDLEEVICENIATFLVENFHLRDK